MSRTSYTLLSAMGSVIDFTGIPVKSSGYYGHTKGLHTVSIYVINFLGRVAIQGSQVLNPTENDWFTVPYPPPYVNLPYIQYPRIRTGICIDPNLLYGGETSNFGFSFNINCLWIRATVTRDYLVPISLPTYAAYTGSTSNAISWLGTVDNILVNY